MLSIHLFKYFFDNHPFLDVGKHVRASWLLIKNNTVKPPTKKQLREHCSVLGCKNVSSVSLSIAIAVTHGHPNESHPFDEHPCVKWRRLTTCQMFVPGCETMGTQLKSERKPSQTSDTTNLEKMVFQSPTMVIHDLFLGIVRVPWYFLLCNTCITRPSLFGLMALPLATANETSWQWLPRAFPIPGRIWMIWSNTALSITAHQTIKRYKKVYVDLGPRTHGIHVPVSVNGLVALGHSLLLVIFPSLWLPCVQATRVFNYLAESSWNCILLRCQAQRNNGVSMCSIVEVLLFTQISYPWELVWSVS